MLVKTIGIRQLSPRVRLVQEIITNDRYKVPTRTIYDYEMIYVVDGGCNYWIQGTEYVLRAGDLLLMPPHTEHHCSVARQGNFRYFAVHFDLIDMGEGYDFSEEEYLKWDYIALDHIPAQEELALRPIVKLGEFEIPYVVHLQNPLKYYAPFCELAKAYAQQGYGRELIMRACMLKIWSWLVSELASRKREEEERSSGHLLAVIQYLHSHYDEQIDIHQLARLVHLTPNYLRVLFKRQTGNTILEYLHHLRMEKAKQLLLERKYTVTEISYMVGFRDVHYFSKMFKKSEGYPPRQYIP